MLSLVQRFLYETDDIKMFRVMLEAISRQLFDFRHGAVPKILLNNGPSYWDRYEEREICQPDVVEEDSNPFSNMYYLLKPAGMYGGAIFKTMEQGGYKNKDDAAQASCNQRVEPKPDKLWLATIYDRPDDFVPRRMRTANRYAAKGWDDLFNKVIEICEQADKAKFYDDHYDSIFPEFDGSASPGFHLQHGHESCCDVLHIAMTFILYGK